MLVEHIRSPIRNRLDGDFLETFTRIHFSVGWLAKANANANANAGFRRRFRSRNTKAETRGMCTENSRPVPSQVPCQTKVATWIVSDLTLRRSIASICLGSKGCSGKKLPRIKRGTSHWRSCIIRARRTSHVARPRTLFGSEWDVGRFPCSLLN